MIGVLCSESDSANFTQAIGGTSVGFPTMSDAALDYVRGCRHPAVKDGTRDLFEAIAHFIPEGETTTPFIGMPTLAQQARIARRTVLKRLPDLVAIGEVLVLDGGLGKIARYQIVHLAGARPIVAAPLPLRADLQPVARRTPSRPTLSDDTTGDLFADPPAAAADPPARYDQTAKNLCRSITGWALQPVIFVHRLVSNLCRSITGWRSESEEPAIFDHRLVIEPVIFDHRLVASSKDRAREELLLLQKSTTTTAAPAEPPRPRAAPPPPCPAFGRAHAWCQGRQHVPMVLHVEERRKLARQPGETDADLDARLFARYAEILAGIPETEPIVDRNEFEFWKRVLRPAPGDTRAKPRAPTASPPPENVWTRVLQRIETKVTRRAFYDWFRGSALVSTDAGVIVVAVDRDLKVDWIRRHYAAEIEEAITEVQPGARVEFVVDAQRRNYG